LRNSGAQTGPRFNVFHEDGVMSGTSDTIKGRAKEAASIVAVASLATVLLIGCADAYHVKETTTTRI
jgi:hypothetical protein